MTPHRAIQSVRQEWITRRLADRIDAALKEVAALTAEWRVLDAPWQAPNFDIHANLLHAETSLARALRLLEAA